MGKIKTAAVTGLKLGCLLPIGLLLGGFALYAVWSAVIGPRTAALGACKKGEGCLYTFFNGNRQVSVVGFSADGDRFLTRGRAGGQIHDGKTGKKLRGVDVGRENYAYSVSGDRSEILAHRKDNVKVLDWEGGLLREWQPDAEMSVRDVVRVPIVKGFAIAEAGVSIWDGNGELITRLSEAEGIMDVAASADGEYLAAYNFVDDFITVWPLQRLEDRVKIEGVEALTMQLSADGALVAAGGSSGAYVWRTADGELVTAVEAEGQKATAAALSEDGEKLAVGFETGAVLVVDVATSEVVRQFDHGSPPNQILFGPEGVRLAVGLDSEVSVSGGELLLRPKPGETIRRGPGANLRQSDNRISVKPGYGVVWSLAE